MSLIIGRADQRKVMIFGDTKLTFLNHLSSNPYVNGFLKQYIVNDQLAFGVVGIREHFEMALPELLTCRSGKQLSERALELKINQNLDFDLLIGEVGVETLYVLKDKKITNEKVAYVGDSDAFGVYQSYFHSKEKPEFQEMGRAYISISRQPEPFWEDSLFPKTYQAFKSTLQSSKAETVGGIVIPLCTDKGCFRYMSYVDIISDPIDFEKFSGPILFGTAEYGAFSVELSDSSLNGGDPSDIGFYFLQGGFGVIFPKNGNGLRNAKVVMAENPAFWVLNTSYEYGAGIASGYMTPDHCGIAGEKLMTIGMWKDALFCYELGKDAKDLVQRTAVYDRYMSGYAVAIFNIGQTSRAVEMLTQLLAKSPNLPLCQEYLFRFYKGLKR